MQEGYILLSLPPQRCMRAMIDAPLARCAMAAGSPSGGLSNAFIDRCLQVGPLMPHAKSLMQHTKWDPACGSWMDVDGARCMPP